MGRKHGLTLSAALRWLIREGECLGNGTRAAEAALGGFLSSPLARGFLGCFTSTPGSQAAGGARGRTAVSWVAQASVGTVMAEVSGKTVQVVLLLLLLLTVL